MKTKPLTLSTILLAISLQTVADDAAKTYKAINSGNPISACVFCADPTVLEYDGRLYVYGSNDHQQYIANGKSGSNGYGDIKSLVVFSTDDMVNWTFHGTIDVAKLCNSWGWRFAASWAPSVTWRVGSDGTPEFFLYFANSGGSIGVLKANSPIGPWTSPLSKPLIDSSTPGVSPCNWIFDPGVVIDEDGTGWIAFGGGDPQPTGSKLMPGNSRMAKLKDSMTAIDGQAVNLPAPYLFEASEMNIIGGRFVYTYNTSWSDRDDWAQYAKRGTAPAPSACSMCYMVTDSPLNPDAWEYRGEYVANPGTFGFGYGNNHTHLQKFGSSYYLFYHSMVLEQSMNTGASGFRSIGVNKVTVNEDKQQLGKVTMNKSGVAATQNLDPYKLQQAETMSTAGGVSYEHFSNIDKASSINGLGNDASKNLQVRMNAGAWTMVRNADFGQQGASTFTLHAKGTGRLEIHLNNISATPAATLEFTSTTYNDHTVNLDPGKFTGVKKVFFVFTESRNVYFDAWQFSEMGTDGVRLLSQPATCLQSLYDLQGRRLTANAKKQSIVVRQHLGTNGERKWQKVLTSQKQR